MIDRSNQVIINAAVQLLAEKGALVESSTLLERLADYSAIIDRDIARFPEALSRALFPALEEVRARKKPYVTAGAELYQGVYLSLEGAYVPVTHEEILEYRKLAKYLPGISGMCMLGCPAVEVPEALQPLYEKLYCWKWDIDGGDAIWDSALLDKLYGLWQIHAAYRRVPVQDIFRGTVYLISPLKLGAVEASHIEYFYRKGLKVSVGTMGSLGATAPVTRTGAKVLQLAEQMFIAHLMRALWGEGMLRGGNSLAVMDMKSMAFRYGRPEANALILEAGALAKHMGLRESYHAGLSDAKAPSFEAGVQKATSAVMAALTGGHGHIAAGLLSVDEIFSPVQMALDGELCNFLNRSLAEEAVNQDTLAYDVLMEVAHGGMFIDREHTVRHLRESLWMPNIFSSDMYAAWCERGSQMDTDYAKHLCYDILYNKPSLEPCISEAEERDIMKALS